MAINKQPMRPGMTSIGQIGAKSTSLSQIQAQKASGINYILYDNIVPNEKNKRYDQIDIESLSYSIEERDLLHNLVVTPAEETGKYNLISGERRWRALGMLRERNPKRFEELFPGGLIPSKVQKLDDIDDEISLIVANTEVRSINVKDRLNDIRRLAELYALKYEQEPKTNVSEMIAKQLAMSERQIRKYMSLDKLVPELMQAFDDGIINIEIASKIAILGETEQLYLVDIFNESEKITEEDIDAAKLLQEKKENTRKEIETKTNEIETLESMKAGAKTEAESTFIETKIADRKKDIASAQQSLSRKELNQARKVTKATRAIEQMTESVDKLQAVWEFAKDDSTVMLKFEMLQLKLNQLIESIKDKEM